MLKEIHEQADAVAETIADRVARGDGVDLDEPGALDEAILADVKRVVVVACGTSYHAGLVGRYAIEEWARLPVEMDIASEYRYRNPVVGPGDLVIGISQSGETADTLAAMRKARERGATVLAITNVMGSQATRDADGVLFTRAGPGDRRGGHQDVRLPGGGHLPARPAPGRAARHAVARAADGAGQRDQAPAALHRRGDRKRRRADRAGGRRARHKEFFLYLGRHVGLPVALEGALKLKEISYIATDAYAAGEMKHGPIALLDESTPVVCVATDSPVLEKIVSNMQEVRARGAHVIALTTAGNSSGRPGRCRDPGARDRLDAATDARGDPAADARLRDSQAARAERGSAAQPREDGHRRVGARLAIAERGGLASTILPA